MAAPVITAISFDKAAYAPGETIVATVTFTPGSSAHIVNFTGTATDSETGQTGTMTSTFTVAETDATVVTAEDDGGRDWTVQPVDAASATASATA